MTDDSRKRRRQLDLDMVNSLCWRLKQSDMWFPVLCLPMKPPLVVSRQDGICASLLEASYQRFQAADGASDELSAAERLQAAAVLLVVLLDQVVDAHGWVAVGHIESAPCGWGDGLDWFLRSHFNNCRSLFLLW